ncbi:hypothetical protein, partial [Streptococcus suis]
FCPNSHYSGKKTDYQTNKQKKTNIKRDVCLHSETPAGVSHLQLKTWGNPLIKKTAYRRFSFPT